MPNYIFFKEKTNEYMEVFFHMNDVKNYNGESGKEIGEWKRIYTKPNAAIDTSVDPYSAKEFNKVTNKKGTLGDLWDRSQECAAKREEKDGVDHIKENYYSNYAKKHKGMVHPEKRKADAKKKLKDAGLADVSFD